MNPSAIIVLAIVAAAQAGLLGAPVTYAAGPAVYASAPVVKYAAAPAVYASAPVVKYAAAPAFHYAAAAPVVKYAAAPAAVHYAAAPAFSTLGSHISYGYTPLAATLVG